MSDTSGEFLTVREAFNTFVTKGDVLALGKNFDDHRKDDREAFEKIDQKLEDLRAERLPKWFLPTLVALGSLLSPFILFALERALKS
jgi:hypothetical protein